MAVAKKKASNVKKSAPAKSMAQPKAQQRASHPTLVQFPKTQRTSASTSDHIAPALQRLIDENDIRRVVTNFAHALDRMDETLLRTLFHSDATLDFGPGLFQGTAGDYVPWVMGVLQAARSSQHLVAQTRVELEGDAALVETYVQSHFRVEKPVGREDLFMGLRYLDRMERRPAGSAGTWKIVHRKQVIDWVRTEAVSDIFYHQNPDALWVGRTKVDPSTQMANFPGSHTPNRGASLTGRRYDSKSMRF